ncbi:hypothetical protein TNCV_3964881 [Trichonephila clavipes]|nr:hypothetical protein TNCV_3964881 [Trichonephila clavipes]
MFFVVKRDATYVKKGIIIDARLAGAFVSRTNNLVVISMTTVSRVLTACINLGKKVKARLPLPRTPSERKTACTRNGYEYRCTLSLPRRIQAVIQIKSRPTP